MVWPDGHRLHSGKYQIERIIRRGGFGITYKALHVRLQQPVVIKTPNEELKFEPDYNQYIERFINEARLLAKLCQDPHPHIVRVSDLFEEGDRHCLVMDFIDGESLWQLVQRRGALPVAEVVQYARQIGSALIFIHQADLVHRDVTPMNIMLKSSGKAVLIDFGIAGEIIPTTIGTKYGNPAFAPYEQMRKGTRHPTADVYTLAASLYYAVTGQRPATSFDRKLDGEPLVPPIQHNRAIADGLNQAILEGMALEASDRPQSVLDWLKLLEDPKAIAPPSVDSAQRRDNVHSASPLDSTPPLIQPATRQTITIPWDWLKTALLGYVFTGLFLAISSAPAWAWAVAMSVVLLGAEYQVLPIAGVLAVVGAIVWAGGSVILEVIFLAVAVFGVLCLVYGGYLFITDRGSEETGRKAKSIIVNSSLTLSYASAVAVVMAVAGSFAVAMPIVFALVGVVVGSVAGFFAQKRLLESFSHFHTFLILAVTFGLGLGMGWLVHQIFQ